MKKVVYTRPDGGVSVVYPVPKEHLERLFGPLDEVAYEAHVMERSIPTEAVKVRLVDDADIPASREFRNAWVDTLADSKVNIDCAKARDIVLDKIRNKRNALLAETDILMTRALEDSNQPEINTLKTRRQSLRDATEPLKSLDVAGKVDDATVLDYLRNFDVS